MSGKSEHPLLPPLPRRTAEILAPVALATLAADILFWKSTPGFSVGLMTLLLALLVLVFGRNGARWRTMLILAGVAVSGWQSVVEISLSNILVSIVFLLALVGDGVLPAAAPLWPKVSEAAFGIFMAPFSWISVAALTLRSGLSEKSLQRIPDSSARAVRIALPSLLLFGVFCGFFSSGNAVFAELASRTLRWLGDQLTLLDFSPAHLGFLALVATLALGLFRGKAFPEIRRWWNERAPRISARDPRVAFLQSGCVLMTLNGLFCVINTIDAFYLWHRHSLPQGVAPAAYLHSGVNALIVVAVLSAVVIAAISQYDDGVADSRLLKNLSHLWIAQNLVLLVGVFLRLKLYVDQFDLTPKRVYVGCFLLLVMSGFLLLAHFSEKRPTLNWLLGRNALATVALFFVLQLVDVDALVARFNVQRWETGGRKVDVEMLAALGPGAWPWLARLATQTRDKRLAEHTQATLCRIEKTERKRESDWGAWQLRSDRLRPALAATAPEGAAPP